jgi:hypothetical protein
MRPVRRLCYLLFFVFVGGFVLPAVAQTPKREHFHNANVVYDWVTNHSGDKLRTFITRPIAAPVGNRGHGPRLHGEGKIL